MGKLAWKCESRRVGSAPHLCRTQVILCTSSPEITVLLGLVLGIAGEPVLKARAVELATAPCLLQHWVPKAVLKILWWCGCRRRGRLTSSSTTTTRWRALIWITLTNIPLINNWSKWRAQSCWSKFARSPWQRTKIGYLNRIQCWEYSRSKRPPTKPMTQFSENLHTKMWVQMGILWDPLWHTTLVITELFLLFWGMYCKGRGWVWRDRDMSEIGMHNVKFTKNQ